VTLDPAIVDRIKELLAQGLTYRKVAAKTGVSRGTVLTIKLGRRHDPAADPPPDPLAAPAEIFVATAVRCPGCGRLVFLPHWSDRCLACLITGNADVRLAIRDTMEPLGVDLHGESLDRYLEIWHRKQKERPPDPPDDDPIS